MAVAGAVEGALVALLVARDDAVAADRAARADGVGEAAQGERVVRAAGVALGLEEVDRVHAPVGEAVRGRVGGVERDGPGRRAVDAAQIDGEVAVDERPHVVVAHEREGGVGAGLVGERVVQLAREREVVPVGAAAVVVGLRARPRSTRGCRSGRTAWRRTGRRWPTSA